MLISFSSCCLVSGPHPDPHSVHVPPVFWQSVVCVSCCGSVLIVMRNIIVIRMIAVIALAMVAVVFIPLNCILAYLNIPFFRFFRKISGHPFFFRNSSAFFVYSFAFFPVFSGFCSDSFIFFLGIVVICGE